MFIQNGKVFVDGEFRELDILIDNGKFVDISKNIKTDEKPINAQDLVIFPGLVDPHVHLREPGGEKKEDLKTGTQAAVAGGFTTVIDMPNNSVPTTTAKRLEEKKKLANEKAVCDVFFHFGTSDSNFEEVIKADPLSLKVYMGRTTGELMLKNPDSLQKHFDNFPKEKPIVLHASDDEEDETENIQHTCENLINAIKFANGRKLHLAHASTKKEVELVLPYDNFTYEIAPHYLFLSKKDLEKLDYLGTVYPPLRSEKNMKELWSVLPKTNCIATDHAPHTLEDKKNGARGFPGLETSMALMLDAYNRNLISLEFIARTMSENPAKLFGLNAGRIEKNAIANLTVIDLKKEWTVKGEDLYTKCKWSPFEGKNLKGKVQSVIYKGNKIFENGEFL